MGVKICDLLVCWGCNFFFFDILILWTGYGKQSRNAIHVSVNAAALALECNREHHPVVRLMYKSYDFLKK